MAKIGRNQPCPCGSGKKYKHCCLPLLQEGKPMASTPAPTTSFSLRAEVEKLQAAAENKEKIFFESGVFILFSDDKGDGWLLEVVDSDAVQVTKAGKPIDVELKENEETIEVNWTHSYSLQDRSFFLTTYKDKTSAELRGAPCQQIRAAIKRIRKRYTPEVLGMIHVENTNSEDSPVNEIEQKSQG